MNSELDWGTERDAGQARSPRKANGGAGEARPTWRPTTAQTLNPPAPGEDPEYDGNIAAYAARLKAEAAAIAAPPLLDVVSQPSPLDDPAVEPGEIDLSRQPDLQAEQERETEAAGARMYASAPDDELESPEPRVEGAARFPQLARAADLEQPPDAHTEWISGVLRPRYLVAIAAQEGVGKTHQLVQLAVQGALAPRTGDLFGAYALPEPLAFAIFDEENGDDALWRVEEQILGRYGAARADLGDRYWRVSFAGVRLGEEAWVRHVTAELERIRERVDVPLVACFDTLSVMVDGDEWGAALKPVIRALRALLKAVDRLAIIGLVHLRKPAEKQGTGRRPLSDVMGNWARSVDSVAIVSDLGAGRVRWEMHKRVPPSSFILAREGGAWQAVADETPESTSGQAERDQRVMDAIDAGAQRWEEVQAATGLSKSTVFRALRDLRGQRVLRKGNPLQRDESDS